MMPWKNPSKPIAWTSVFLLFMCLGLNGVSAQSVDPRTPEEWQEQQKEHARNWSRWPKTRVAQLRKEKEHLLTELSLLPQLHPIAAQNRFGYHSSFGKNDSGLIIEDHRIDLTFNSPFIIRSIAMAPAIATSESGREAYAFPKRFKLEALNDAGESTMIVNWLDENFPDPGQLPVVFSDFEVDTKHIRLTVPLDSSAPKESYFALGEIYLWGGQKGSSLVDNFALWDTTKVVASDDFSLPPKWELEYIRDGVSGLGFPLHNKQGERPDFAIVPNKGPEPAQSIELLIDLGKPIQIGRFDVWPALSPDGLALSGVGFPSEIAVDVSNDPEFKTYRAIDSTTEPNRGETGALFSVCVRPPDARYLRIALDGLQTMNGKRILNLGEIAIYDSEGNLAPVRLLSQTGIPAEYSELLPRLFDGFCWGRQILPDLEWLKGLAMRRPLEQRLATVESELTSAEAVWQYLQVRLIIGAVVVVMLFLVSVVLFQRLQKKWVLMKQGDRINRDLHDEIGSSLGSITLLADELAELNQSESMNTDLDDLSLMAREANASLREIVKIRDQDAMPLETLLQILLERAERVLRGMSVEGSLPTDCPDSKVSLHVKRHITMFFKEAIHNCARHSKASRVTIFTTTNASELSIEITDNGSGFDTKKAQIGWGLSNMRQRAEEISGRLNIASQPNQGTTITLTVPLKELKNEPKLAYETSNK